jgi:hypothetical protein
MDIMGILSGELTHWRNDPGQYLDSDFVSYLKWLKHSGELEKSVVIVMAEFLYFMKKSFMYPSKYL